MGRENGIVPMDTSPAQPTISQSQTQAQLQPRIPSNQFKTSPVLGNLASFAPSTTQAYTSLPPIQIPPPPPFSSVKFSTIGQEPKLLKRFSGLAPAPGNAVHREPQGSDHSTSPEPTLDNVSGNASTLGLGRPSLLQALGGSDSDSDPNMDVDLAPFESTSSNPGAGAVPIARVKHRLG